MTRDEIAVKAMRELINTSNKFSGTLGVTEDTAKLLASAAYLIADAMVAHREASAPDPGPPAPILKPKRSPGGSDRGFG